MLSFGAAVDDFRDGSAGLFAVCIWIERVDVTHFFTDVERNVDACFFKLLGAFDDVGVEYFPSTTENVGGREPLHVAVKRRYHRIVSIHAVGPR